ncbi:ABC transporter permease [Sporolactobacillus laevolacticus]|uniref:Glycine/betaine ABC transporter permease n=1 Tax=Sporolactobacillus laevolacticus DSM 442 TaxID=1395513 RepID=V6IW86_9BACL|nr:ABC transporter permease [Sporolactobacillus laevolacticus]EST11553.1 glycine/betaine ABC transporter permease [Sporolactobacillus laevolacticus DSM 442]MDN3956464.1 ABC transporter permease [Sporolactobacillus laevolacticus]
MIHLMLDYLSKNFNVYLNALLTHIGISLIVMLIGIVIAIPFGVVCAKYVKLSESILGLFNLLRLIPSLAVLIVLMPVLGTGLVPAVIALTFLAFPAILINTCIGFTGINPSVIEAAKGMGMSKQRILFTIEFPLAFPMIITGIRTAAVEVIASATLAAYIGSGGLGDLIIIGLSLPSTAILLVGGLSVAILSIITDVILSITQKRLTKFI